MYGMVKAKAKALPTARDMALMAVLEVECSAHGLTQEAIGSAIGVHQTQVSRIFAGVRPVTLTELTRLLDLLGLSLSDAARRAGI